MNAPAKIAVAVASGYLLGRTRKLKLAISVGGLLAGQRIATHPAALLSQGKKLVDKSPELQRLQGDISGRLMDAARAAAITTATQRIEGLNRQLTAASAPEEDEYVEADEDVSEEEAEDEDEAYEDEGDEPEEEPPPPPRKRAQSRKSSAKKTPAKKQPAKRSSAKKSSAKKSSAKKQPARKQAAKKSTSKSGGSSRSSRSTARK